MRRPPSLRRAARPLIAPLLLLAACASPEAARTRGGGQGADIGNRREVLEFHAGARPYHRTPCVTQPVECAGPEPVFGTELPVE